MKDAKNSADKKITATSSSASAALPEEIRFAALAIDVVCFRILDGQLMVLLCKVGSQSMYKGMWAHIGGLILPDESADETVCRFLREKAGIDSKIYFEQLYTFSEVNRDPRGRVVAVAHIALTPHDPQEILSDDIETVWTPVAKIPKLGYDHNIMLDVAIERLRSKFEYTNIAQHLLQNEFTLSDLQNAYEIVMGKGLDKRNFRKKILATGMIKDTGKTFKKGAMRPAALYAFVSKKQQIMQIL